MRIAGIGSINDAEQSTLTSSLEQFTRIPALVSLTFASWECSCSGCMATIRLAFVARTVRNTCARLQKLGRLYLVFYFVVAVMINIRQPNAYLRRTDHSM